MEQSKRGGGVLRYQAISSSLAAPSDRSLSSSWSFICISRGWRSFLTTPRVCAFTGFALAAFAAGDEFSAGFPRASDARFDSGRAGAGGPRAFFGAGASLSSSSESSSTDSGSDSSSEPEFHLASFFFAAPRFGPVLLLWNGLTT